MNASVVMPLDSRGTSPDHYGAPERTVAYAATGRPPFGGGSLHGVCYRVLRGAADLYGVPEPVLGVLWLALRRDPADRPPAAWLGRRLAGPAPVMDGMPCSA